MIVRRKGGSPDSGLWFSLKGINLDHDDHFEVSGRRVEGRGGDEGWVLKGVRLTRMGSKSNYSLLLARDVSYEGCEMDEFDPFKGWFPRMVEEVYRERLYLARNGIDIEGIARKCKRRSGGFDISKDKYR
jgi:hypothetical protein